ncbi:MFS transporter [Bifidobacterium simiarum]|uniref:MFS transporter n=1 Tax=Bifidobacterium simiarum TaxID=2045441 RepID=A0A2M9HFD6_9BIFI|nr:MFS transporter [Bifidobacterium simiarum]PJM75527.1 MFS transporter [Bifidobacterium simiarum]
MSRQLRKSIGTVLTLGAGAGSFLSATAIVSLSSTITIWQKTLPLTTMQVGLLSGLLSLAIAVGSLSANSLGRRLGRVSVYRMVLFPAALGFLICAMAPNFAVLLAGMILVGVTTGADLPLALSLVSDPHYTKSNNAKCVSLTQSGWQLGILVTLVSAFGISWFEGDLPCRFLFLAIAVISCAVAIYRLRGTDFTDEDMSHEQCLRAASENIRKRIGISGGQIFFWRRFGRSEKSFFASILVFYVFWNFLGNTWGQFQTFIFVNADASQSLATGIGILVCVLTFMASFLVPLASGTRFEHPLFCFGGMMIVVSLVVLVFRGDQLWWLIGATATLNTGLVLSGEATSKVWIQTLFKDEDQRTSVQGFTLAFSRILCSLLALVTPSLVVPDTIRTTMMVFLGFAVISLGAGLKTIRSQVAVHGSAGMETEKVS